jgi:hypothetical protein
MEHDHVGGFDAVMINGDVAEAPLNPALEARFAEELGGFFVVS